MSYRKKILLINFTSTIKSKIICTSFFSILFSSVVSAGSYDTLNPNDQDNASLRTHLFISVRDTYLPAANYLIEQATSIENGNSSELRSDLSRLIEATKNNLDSAYTLTNLSVELSAKAQDYSLLKDTYSLLSEINRTHEILNQISLANGSELDTQFEEKISKLSVTSTNKQTTSLFASTASGTTCCLTSSSTTIGGEVHLGKESCWTIPQTLPNCPSGYTKK